MATLSTLDDLHAAIAARLSGSDAQTTCRAAGAIYASAPVCPGIEQPDNAMADVLRSFGIAFRGSPGPAFHALLAMGAEAAGDWCGFFPSAFLVLEAQRQCQRASTRRGGDALDRILRKAMADHPEFTPAMLWAELARRASSPQIADEALSSYDNLADELTFEPSAGAALVDIDYPAFRRRVARIKKSLRHEPASVAPCMDDADHQPRLKAAA